MPTGIYFRTKLNRENLSKAKKGIIPWNKGKKGVYDIETIKRMSSSHKGKTFSPEVRGEISEKLKGEKSYAWKGDKVGYRVLHLWVRKYKGKPIKCIFCGVEKTTPKSIHWANKSHKYKRALTDWISLCAFCHKKYDKGHRRSLVKI